MKKILLISLILLATNILGTYSFANSIVSIRHEEDMTGTLHAEIIQYKLDDLTTFMASNTELIKSVELRFNSYHSIKFAHINVVYNKLGELLGIFKNDNSNEDQPLGIIIDSQFKANIKETVSKNNLIEKMMLSTHISYFDFNDPVQDLTHPPTNIDLHRGKLIPFYIYDSGIQNSRSTIERYKFAKNEATGAMDYFKHFTKPTLIEGRLYNMKDAGNFSWAVGMRKLGFDYLEVKIGSEINAFFNTREQNDDYHGIILMGDSKKDQTAILKGYYSYISRKVNDLEMYRMILQDFYIPHNPNLLPMLCEDSIDETKYWQKWLANQFITFKVPLSDWNSSSLLMLSRSLKYMRPKFFAKASAVLLKAEATELISLYQMIDYIFEHLHELDNCSEYLMAIIENSKVNRYILKSIETNVLENMDQIDDSERILKLVLKKLSLLPNEEGTPVIQL